MTPPLRSGLISNRSSASSTLQEVILAQKVQARTRGVHPSLDLPSARFPENFAASSRATARLTTSTGEPLPANRLAFVAARKLVVDSSSAGPTSASLPSHRGLLPPVPFVLLRLVDALAVSADLDEAATGVLNGLGSV